MIKKNAAVFVCLTGMLAASTVAADTWNEKTILTFSSPVIVPGATLPAGRYVFELANSRGNRHLVRITNEATQDVIVQTQAVPARRASAGADTILQFNPTERGVPPAIKAWFYPGSRYGHEFVYDEAQARQIAERTKTIVLSVDVPGTDLEKGALRVYDAARGWLAWQGDADTLQEWDAFTRSRSRGSDDERQRAVAPSIAADFRGARVSLDDLEDHPDTYVGQRISVDGEVEEVYGPRLFTIDEARWGDLDGEILVLLPTSMAALVKNDDRVTVSGTVRRFARAEIEREWGWLGLDPEIEVDVAGKPILVAERLVGGNNNAAMVIEVAKAERTGGGAVGTSGRSGPATDPSVVATAGAAMVGQHTRLNSVRVAATPAQQGFFIAVGNGYLFVLPSQPVALTSGTAVTIDGVILQMPRGMVARLNAPAGLNEDVYIYAMSVTK